MTTENQIAQATIETLRDVNSALQGASVQFAFRGHYANTATGVCGIEALVKSFLVTNGSTFTNGAENSAMRPVVVAGAMFKGEIESLVREAFGHDRYPANTLRVVLGNSKFNAKQGADNGIRSIQLTKAEDKSGRKPRAKYYLDTSFAK